MWSAADGASQGGERERGVSGDESRGRLAARGERGGDARGRRGLDLEGQGGEREAGRQYSW